MYLFHKKYETHNEFGPMGECRVEIEFYFSEGVSVKDQDTGEEFWDVKPTATIHSATLHRPLCNVPVDLMPDEYLNLSTPDGDYIEEAIAEWAQSEVDRDA